jgi:hypothetical protein
MALEPTTYNPYSLSPARTQSDRKTASGQNSQGVQAGESLRSGGAQRTTGVHAGESIGNGGAQQSRGVQAGESLRTGGNAGEPKQSAANRQTGAGPAASPQGASQASANATDSTTVVGKTTKRSGGDGSVTVSTTYADGHVKTSTTPSSLASAVYPFLQSANKNAPEAARGNNVDLTA